MIRKAALFFVVAGLALAGARTYTVNLFEKATFGDHRVKAGRIQGRG